MRIRSRLLPRPPLSFPNFREVEMQLSRFVAMMSGAGNGEMEKA
jgi:hypothetical protein